MNKMLNSPKDGTIKLLGDLEDKLIQSFFDWAGDTIRDFCSNKGALRKAEEGKKEEYFKERLEMVAEDFRSGINDTPLFTEEELEKKFYLLYEKLNFKSNVYNDDINEKELFKYFKVYAKEYTGYLEKELSIGERRLLERTAEISNKVDKILTKEDFERRSKEYTDLLNTIFKDQDKPFIHITDNQIVSIEEFAYKYIFLHNTFDLVKNHAWDEEDSLVLTFFLKNAGKIIVEDICIFNLKLLYCADVYDDNPECGYYVLPAVKYTTAVQETLNIIPDCEQKIHIIFRQNDEKLEDECYNDFLYDYCYDRIQLSFTLTARTAKESLDYDVILSMSRSEQSDKTITGAWEIDAVSMTAPELIDRH